MDFQRYINKKYDAVPMTSMAVLKKPSDSAMR
jgi:hypothetical protein